jgi:hypothetical protein
MNRFNFVFIFFVFVTSTIFGQDTTAIHSHGMYLVKAKPIANDSGDCIFCNPEIMHDRILLDSNKVMIARKTSTDLGYTYYEWRNEKHAKTFEEIRVLSPSFKTSVYYSDSGTITRQKTECSSPFTIEYSTDSLKTIEKIRLRLNQQETDTVLDLFDLSAYKPYAFQAGKTKPNTSLWKEITFYPSGKIKSTGVVVTSTFETINNSRVGTWKYYDETGQLKFKKARRH